MPDRNVYEYGQRRNCCRGDEIRIGRLHYQVSKALRPPWRCGSRSARSSCRLEVARLENQLNSLLERLNVGVFRATSEGNLLESNQAFLHLFDASNLADVQGIYRQQLFLQPLDSGESGSQNLEITFPLADGRVKWIRFSQYLYSAEGESTIEGLVEDVTELKQAELALRQFN